MLDTHKSTLIILTYDQIADSESDSIEEINHEHVIIPLNVNTIPTKILKENMKTYIKNPVVKFLNSMARDLWKTDKYLQGVKF